MKKSGKLIIAGASAALFIILIILLRTADVAAIGPEGTKVGLSGINGAVSASFGFNNLWYRITTVLGIISICTALFFMLFGLFQCIKLKSVLKVDRELLALGGLYFFVVLFYGLFEFVIVNYRPVIMPGDEHVEASFPSTHTMLVCVIMGSAIMILGKYIKNASLRLSLRIICGIIIAATVLGRLFAGVHWFTDILGGLLLGCALLAAFSYVLDICNEQKKKG